MTAIDPGDRLGPYTVVGSLGAGGMGEVWRARDTRLGREVAIKVLPEDLVDAPERIARFEREARALAAVNHPGIATIHELEERDGLPILVLELIEGESLARRLEGGAPEIEEAIRIGTEIAAAVAAAHDAGVLHRDLKPGNVMLSETGRVKVLDFGLAKWLDARSADGADAPTESFHRTEDGRILGTPAYLSPEQARGEAVDQRTDVWAFGCLLYELLTGKALFSRATPSDSLAAVLTEAPDWSFLPEEIPSRVRLLLDRCLRRDRERPLRDLGDAWLELTEVEAGEPGPDASGSSTGPPKPLRATVLIPEEASLAPAPPGFSGFSGTELALSADGRHLVWAARSEGDTRLWRRTLSQWDVQPIRGSEGAYHPFLSPDGAHVAFFAGEKLEVMDLGGGVSAELADVLLGFGGCWTDANEVVFVSQPYGGLMKVPATGGEVEEIATPEPSRREIGYCWPDALPGGGLLFGVEVQGREVSRGRVALRTPDGEVVTLLEDAAYPRYDGVGAIYFAREGSLWRASFDEDRSEITGPEMEVCSNLLVSSLTGLASFGVSREGTLVYGEGGMRRSTTEVGWIDEEGSWEALSLPERHYLHPRLGPDGDRILLESRGSHDHLWLYDLSDGTLTRLTFEGDNLSPLWSPDGDQLAMAHHTAEPPEISWMPVNVPGERDALTPPGPLRSPTSWSPDGGTILYTELDPQAGASVGLLSLEEPRKRRRFRSSPGQDRDAVFSPDGDWIAFSSDESGRFEVYVRPVQGPGKWMVSDEGGRQPVWGREGTELFYRNGSRILRAEVDLEPTFRVSSSELVAEGPFAESEFGASYDVGADGRLLIAREVEDEPLPGELRVVLGLDLPSP